VTPLLSEALQEAYASASTEDVVVDTLEVVAGTQHLYLCRGFTPITLKLEDGSSHEFLPIPFEFNLPGQDSTGAQTLNVGVENVDGTVASFVQSALLSNTPIYVKYRSYLPNRFLTVPEATTATILGSEYGLLRMPDGRQWLASNLLATGYGSISSVGGTAANATDTVWGRYYNYTNLPSINAALTDGWRVPSPSDFSALVSSLGGHTTAGGQLKTVGTTYWLTPNAGASDAYGFSWRGSGQGVPGSVAYYQKQDSAIWGYSTPTSGQILTVNYGGAASATYAMSGGLLANMYPVRLVRDYTPPAPTPDLYPQNPRPLVLTVTAAELTLKGVTFSASVADFVNQPFPNAFYSFTAFPGLR
jgi:uncharacterized protein (TIGR02145 family)